MTLPKNVYLALEDIVGARNISDDPAVLDSYTLLAGSYRHSSRTFFQHLYPERGRRPDAGEHGGGPGYRQIVQQV